jgi:hypothetical protein
VGVDGFKQRPLVEECHHSVGVARLPSTFSFDPQEIKCHKDGDGTTDLSFVHAEAVCEPGLSDPYFTTFHEARVTAAGNLLRQVCH